ncbi:MAG TPA: hypothetical protein VIZ20_01760 [Streptosporangiaceae bacterium]
MWQASRVRPARALARIPARASLASAPGMSAETIALSPGGRPSPARSRLASRTSCSWITGTPICSITSSAGAVPTHDTQAGEVSKRRAPLARSMGGP